MSIDNSNNTGTDSFDSSVLIVGAGISGLSCAKHLHDLGISVRVIDQGFRIGGRASTRRTHDGDAVADHGAPCFEAQDPAFQDVVTQWMNSGVCARWDVDWVRWIDGSFVPSTQAIALYTGFNTMDSIVRYLGSDIEVWSGVKVHAMDREQAGWTVHTESTGGRTLSMSSKHVVLATHPRESIRLIDHHSEFLTNTLKSASTSCIWVLMIRIHDTLQNLPSLIDVEDEVIARILRDDHKPGRARIGGSSSLVVHADADWSSSHREMDRENAKSVLIEHTRALLTEMLGIKLHDHAIQDAQAHRWGSAHPIIGLSQLCEVDDDARIVLCGDTFGWQGRSLGIQSAWLSGRAAAAVLSDGIR